MSARRMVSALAMVGAACVASPAHASDACETVLCMAGMLLGSGGGDECTRAIEDYFSIISYHNGHIDYTATPKNRLSFLQGCSSEDGWASTINNAYGSTIE
jgi:hypothetical protein